MDDKRTVIYVEEIKTQTRTHLKAAKCNKKTKIAKP